MRPQRLTLDENGFRLSGGLVLFSRKILWREVEEFLILRPGKRMIGYRYKPSAGKNSYWTMLNRMFGADGGLAGEWPLPLDQVVDELNARLDRHNSTASPN